MKALKEKVEELIVNQNHILKAVKYLNERLENIIEKSIGNEDIVKDIFESKAGILKNSDEIKTLMKIKKENADAMDILETQIEIINGEIETIRKDIKDKPAVNGKGQTENSVKTIQCNTCRKTFDKFCDLEQHIKIFHDNHPVFRCEVCEKNFVLKWRLKKHSKIHNGLGQPCHYYNNNKVCPFEELGCKFNHIPSENCSLGEACGKTKCPFKHDSKEKIANDTKSDKSNLQVSDMEDINGAEDRDDVEDSDGFEDINFVTSTPIKRKFECEECKNISQCVECFVNQHHQSEGQSFQ